MSLRSRAARFVVGSLAASAFALLAPSAGAVQKVLKVDKFADDPSSAANEIQAASNVSCQAGFYQSEAYGVLFVPAESDYPFDILSIDLIQGDTGDPVDTANDVTFDIYNEDGVFSQPTTQPIFTLASTDYFIPPDTFGQPVLENTFMLYQFDPGAEPENHPKKITSGNVLVMVRFDNPELPIAGVSGCETGCQDPCVITDDSITSQRNVIRATGDQWAFAESFGVKGDWVLRLQIDAASAGTGSGGGSATTSTTSSGSGGGATGAGGAGGGASNECNTDADCPQIDQVCRAHTCQSTGNEETPADEGGCGCEVGATPKGGTALVALAALAWLGRRKRR